ncbi:MAG: HlyD family efflux transporter periplasmic adaptor subunit [Acidobacteriota bacterium]
MTRKRKSSAADGSWSEGPPVFPARPPAKFFRALAWLLISLFAVALAAAIFVRIPDSVTSRFILEPAGGADPIQSPRQAVVEEVRLRPGDRVRRGDLLFVLRADDVADWRTQLDTQQQNLRALHERSAKLDESHRSMLLIKDSEIAQAQREADFRKRHLATMRDLANRAESLGTSGTISAIDLINRRLALAESGKDLAVAEKSLVQSQLDRQRLGVERQRQQIEEDSAARGMEIEIAGLRRKLDTTKKDLLEIRAPYDAVCVRTTQQNPGSVVAAGAELCQLARSGVAVEARLLLPENGLSRLKPGQQVRYFFDAFPYQRYGVASGILNWISQAAVTGSDGTHFVARATIDHAEFKAGGERRPVTPGMQGEARIVVGRRALIEYAFEPLRELREDVRP